MATHNANGGHREASGVTDLPEYVAVSSGDSHVVHAGYPEWPERRTACRPRGTLVSGGGWVTYHEVARLDVTCRRCIKVMAAQLDAVLAATSED